MPGQKETLHRLQPMKGKNFPSPKEKFEDE